MRTRLIAAGAALAGALAFAVVVATPAESTIPAGKRVGLVTYGDVIGSTDLKHPIRAFSLGVQQEGALGTGGGGGTGKAIWQRVSVVQEASTDSPLLNELVATGKHLKAAVVVLYQPDSTKLAHRYTLSDVLLTSAQISTSGPSSAIPTESVTIGFGKVVHEAFAANGTTVVRKSCFDLKLNAKC